MTVFDEARVRKPVKTLFGWLFFRRLSVPISLKLAKTRITPSAITAIGLAIGIAGAGLLATGTYRYGVIGAVFAAIAKLLDAVDGEVARVKHLDTAGGYVADGLCDRLRDTSVIVGLGVGAHRMGEVAALPWLIGALVGYLGFFYVSGAAPSHWREVRVATEVDEKHMFRVSRGIRLGAGDTLAVAVLVAALAGKPLWLVIAIAIAAPAAVAMKVRRLYAQRPWERDG